MKYKEFLAMCGYYGIIPSILLEDQEVIDLLKAKASREDIEKHIEKNY